MSGPLQAVRRLRGVPVLVIGDVIADRYLFGMPTRVSREAPVLVLEYQGDATIPGGAANAAGNVRSLGGKVELAGVVGDDVEADLLRAQLRTLAIRDAGLVVEEGRLTTSKTRVFAGPKSRGQQVVRFDRATPDPPHPRTRAALRAVAEALVGNARALLVSDYGYGAVDPAGVNRLIASCQRRRVPVVVDTQGDLSAYKGATLITPNLAELEGWSRRRLRELADIETAGAALLRRAQADAVLCTRGSEGMSLITATRSWHIPVARRAEVFDVAGAGDTVAAALALGLGAGLELPLAAVLANCAASVVVQKLGAATCSPAELRAAIRGMDPVVPAAQQAG
jgi:D-glycero-beta-D-manno-heptose-7-phosphate kinase